MILTSVSSGLDELVILLEQLDNKDYSRKCTELGNATIGEHTRHIIEMFICLETQYNSGIINYDLRERNLLLQSDTACAVNAINSLKKNLSKPDKALILQQVLNGNAIKINTNYNRELLYNLEHCIHHQALIKVGLIDLKNIRLNSGFGVASSTIEYRNKCVQ